jgi:hypothetical protein
MVGKSDTKKRVGSLEDERGNGLCFIAPFVEKETLQKQGWFSLSR